MDCSWSGVRSVRKSASKHEGDRAESQQVRKAGEYAAALTVCGVRSARMCRGDAEHALRGAQERRVP